MKAATSASIPTLTLPRPALELLADFGPGVTDLSLHDAIRRTQKPKSTVARWLGLLVDSNVILRARRDEYAVPSWPTLALILNEPSSYARSLLLQHDLLDALKMPHAFACLPIRRSIPVSIHAAAPALKLDEQRVMDLDTNELPTAFRLHFTSKDRRHEDLRFPTNASDESTAIERRFPTLVPDLALALFAASADARVVNAALGAAVKLGLDPEVVKTRAGSFVVEEPPLKGAYPNTLVLPRWLSAFHASATSALGREYLRRDAKPPRHAAGEDS